MIEHRDLDVPIRPRADLLALLREVRRIILVKQMSDQELLQRASQLANRVVVLNF